MTQQNPTDPHALQQALQQAQANLNAGQTVQAVTICRQILVHSPGEPHALHMLGLIAFNSGQLAQAIALIGQSCQSPAAPATYHSNLGEMLRLNGQLSEAEAPARRAVALAPNLPSAWNNLGIILQETGRLVEARVCIEKAIGFEPANAGAHNNLGNTLKRMEDLVGAERCWRRALELNPNYAEPHSNLANLCKDQGQYEQALAHGQQAIRLQPGLLDAYINLAAVETARFRHHAALGWLDVLLRSAPDHALALAARANARKELDQLDEALADAERAARFRPDNAEVQNALGSVLLAHGRFDAAIAAFDRALAIPSPIRERVLVSRAMAFQENGQSDTALTELDAALEEFPRSASAWHGRADIVKFTADDPAIVSMEALLGSGGLQSLSDRMSLHFALGKAYLDCGDSDAAFRHLDQGNAMKRSTITYDPAAATGWLHSVAQGFDLPLLDRFKDAGAQSAMPIFIVGMPRSGTTLIEQILASHQAVQGAGELKLLSQVSDRFGTMPQLLDGLTAERLQQMGDHYAAKVALLAEGRPHVVDKMPANFIHAGLIRLILPNARIIHARRNPVDTCLSCYSKLFGGEQSFTYNQTELGRFYRDYDGLMAHWREVLPASHFLEVVYEDVIGDIEAEARRMLEFLGLPWDPACLSFYETRRPVRTASVNQVRQPIYKTSAGRWRAHADNLRPLLEELAVGE